MDFKFAMPSPMAIYRTLGLILVLCVASTPVVAQEQCDQKQALNMLTRIGAFKQQFMRDNGAQVEKVTELAIRSAHGGTLIGQKRYDEACAHYRALARDFNFDLSQSKAMSVDQINAYEDNAEEGCDIRSIVQRSNNASVQIASLRGKVDPSTHGKLSKQSNDLGMLMRTDLAQACQVSMQLEADLQQYAAG